MKNNKICLFLINWGGIDRTDPNTEERTTQVKYIEEREGCDLLRYFDPYYYDLGWRLYCFTTKKQAKSLMERCISQERK